MSSQSEEDTTEHILGYNKGDKKFNLNDERKKEWGKIVEVYRKNKKNRSIDNNIGEEQNIFEDFEKRRWKIEKKLR